MARIAFPLERPLNSPLPPPPLASAHTAQTLDELPWVAGFGRLPPPFYTRLAPTALAEPYLVGFSSAAAGLIGLDPAQAKRPDVVAVLAGNRVPTGAEPLAAVYAGHQFGVYVPQLGDGRAILLGGVPGADGRVWELQLKGCGRTPYSRMGDGRAVLRSSIREFLCSEAMHGLGIPTTRALAVVGADEPVFRETVETAAVVTRMSPSFVRFGTFEYFYWAGQHDDLRLLADYVIDSFYPDCRDAAQPCLALLAEVTRRTARLVAQWQGVGFCHGVLNSDNMSILGLTIDYGPFQFIDGFSAAHVCNHSDEHGRYAYDMQPQIGHWNLYCLGQALIPLIEDVTATQAVLDGYRDEFAQAMEELFRAKLGLATADDGDADLTERLVLLLDRDRVDWTIFWRALSRLRVDRSSVTDDAPVRDLFVDRAAFDAWVLDYRARMRREGSTDVERAARMNRVNPKYVLRNYLAEIAIRRAGGDVEGRAASRDFSEVERLLRLLQQPFDEQPEFESYAAAPPDWAGNLHLSCSS
ncbi:MAG: protein adenylyltransferase SelO [Gemmatimonadota bacterium]